jgi:hypothetical protein
VSSSEQRRSSPRRRHPVDGMHPGWACFLLAFGSGCCTMMALAFAYRWLMGWDRLPHLIFFAVLATVLFCLGGRRAEKLF